MFGLKNNHFVCGEIEECKRRTEMGEDPVEKRIKTILHNNL
jgi:hypothetical protein